MPKFRVEMSAQLENVGSVTIPADYPWFCNLLCGNCGEKSEKPVVLLKSEEVEGVRGGSVNFRRTCKFCDRVSDVTILKENMTYSESDSSNWAPILHVECRGTELDKVSLADDVPLTVAGTEGFQFEGVILEGGEYYSYDEDRKIEASISEFKTRVVKE